MTSVLSRDPSSRLSPFICVVVVVQAYYYFIFIPSTKIFTAVIQIKIRFSLHGLMAISTVICTDILFDARINFLYSSIKTSTLFINRQNTIAAAAAILKQYSIMLMRQFHFFLLFPNLKTIIHFKTILSRWTADLWCESFCKLNPETFLWIN